MRHRCLSDTVTGTNIVATIVSDFWSERVHAPAVGLHTLVENVVATINTIIFSLSLPLLSSDSLTFLSEGVVLGS